ncbi:MAG: hypothetical protein ACFB20_09440 [Opitutales bacterium]
MKALKFVGLWVVFLGLLVFAPAHFLPDLVRMPNYEPLEAGEPFEVQPGVTYQFVLRSPEGEEPSEAALRRLGSICSLLGRPRSRRLI